MTTKRQFVDTETFEYDPRFLVFEYVFDIVLRARQIEIVESFRSSTLNGDSRVQQMIMGAGKTTVVGPLLALIFADGQRSVTQVVPGSLLEMSRSVMRAAFSAVMKKSVYTFSFNRRTKTTPVLYDKLVRARQKRAVVCSTPTAVKSFVIKLVEMLHNLDYASRCGRQVHHSHRSYNLVGADRLCQSTWGRVPRRCWHSCVTIECACCALLCTTSMRTNRIKSRQNPRGLLANKTIP